MSEMTRRAVQAAWEELGRVQEYPNPEALEAAIQSEAERLAEMIADETDRLRSLAIAQFRANNQGHFPPYLETVQIGNRARAQAEELILWQELGEEVELEADQEYEGTVADQSWQTSPDRWRTNTDVMGDPSPEIDALTEDVWPEQTIRFRVMAAFLMQTRYEDSQPIPEDPDDPLKAQFTDLIEAELERRESVLSEARGLRPSNST
ncbi:hypothetical protein G6027_16175 [Dietzia sp. SLG310A2-38A2]|jgi:hypothetical protein|uniref:hypothetical protein n=2 Tax=Dietziaceae TaxID=85029 RepID=UPI0015CBB55A|nr:MULTISPECIES: hypothetical protein [Dietzia]MBB1032386.1 hypothetical protein [Dietzia sp. SLG310A2-38A2]